MMSAHSDGLEYRFGDGATLGDRLQIAAEAGTGGLIYVRPGREERRQSYAELRADALRIAAGLRAGGVAAGDPVLLQLEDAEDFFPGLWGALLAGAVPVPAAVAPTYAQPNGGLQKLLNAAKLLERAPVIAAGAAFEGLRNLSPTLGQLTGKVWAIDALRRYEPAAPESLPRRLATDTAVLLLTSGSTGQSKGVPLTHRNLLAMAAGTIKANGFSARDVTLNWMALDHVGSVSFLGIMPLALACTQVHVPTGYILQEPLRWLELISQHRATISWAPNFAFTLFLERAAAVEAGQWDLRSMRFLVNAGEAVVARTARRFISLLQRHGLPADALRPAFGMSETCSGITWSRGLTLENTPDDEPFVDLGPCIPGAEMRVVNEKDEPVAEGERGLLQLRGASVFGGYFKNPEENARVFRDGWFTTGDEAFLRGGCLHISGRLKDVIIVNGANFYCHEIEEAAEAVPGLLKTFTAACAIREAGDETDQLAVFFCLADSAAPEAAVAVAKAIRARLIRDAGVPPAYLVALRPADIPKTEIGKIQRAQLKKAFEAGAFRDRVVPLTRAAGKAKRGASEAARPTRSQLMPAIARIWEDVLGLDEVGYDETFFELGGHSLLVVKVQSRLQELVGRPVAVVELFNCPTVRTMAEHFAREFEDATPAAAPDAGSVARPLTVGSQDIAIIGIGLRFPGASSPEEFWRVLSEGRETISFFTAEEALAEGVDPEIVRQPNHVRAAPLLDAPEAFDAEFFKYSAKEARLIDPQQRVFLEVCWEAFEDAGYDPLTYPGKVGLFAAAGMNTYLANNLLANEGFMREENGGRMLTVDSMNGFNVMITNDKDYLPVRVSYKLNLRGPSVNVQSACSSTLLTLHEACKSIRHGDCAMALAGGVSIKLPQRAGHLYSAGMLNSPDGHCRAYDEKAEGTIFGNGAGVVLLKPLAAALADGDRVYAVVKGTAANNDGAGKVGFTAPSAIGEEDVCAEALARAGVSPESVTFMEGHGTGTALGDPIEVNALSSAFRRQTDRVGFCALGSVKTNVGHLQIASGIAGLIKTTLALHHRQIPGTLHFEKPNPRIDFAQTPFFVNRELRAWESPHGPRRAGVNSLGIGGTNVHAILEEAPVSSAVASSVVEGPQVLPLSARHPRALRQMARAYAEALEDLPASALGDAAFTAQVGRAALPVRAAFVSETKEELGRKLRAFADAPETVGETVNFDRHGVVFLFTGAVANGGDWVRELQRTEPVFRDALDRAVVAVEAERAGGIVRRWWREKGTPMPAKAEGDDLLYFAFEYALAELLASYGIDPAATAGQGAGLIGAACRAGVFTFEEGLQLVAARGRLLAARPGENADDDFLRVAGDVAFVASERRVFSTADGVWLGSEIATAEFWLRQARAVTTPVGDLAVLGVPVIVRLGASDRVEGANVSSRLLAAADFAGLLATLFELGYPVKWSASRRARPGRRISLPTYPWQHQAYWIDGTDLRVEKRVQAVEAEASTLLGRRWWSPRVRECVYEVRFDPRVFPVLAEHRVHGRLVTPGALYLAQVAAQAEDWMASRGGAREVVAVLSDVVFVSAMTIDPEQPPVVQTVFTPEGESTWRFEVLSWTDDSPERVAVHATGKVTTERGALDNARVVRPQLSAPQSVEKHYAVMDAMAVGLGPSFRWIREIHAEGDESLLRLEVPAGLDAGRGWHAGLVDSFLQAAVAAGRLDGTRTLIPFRVERAVFHRPPGVGPWFAQARRVTGSAEGVRTDVRLYDADGNVQAEVSGFELRTLSAEDVQPAGQPDLFEVTWEPLAGPSLNGEKRASGAWILLSDRNEYGRKLRQALEAAGETVETISISEVSRLDEVLRARRWSGVIHAAHLGAETPDEIRWAELLVAVKKAARAEGGALRWVFLTDDPSRNPASSPLSGFATGLAHEMPEWRPLHVEIDAAQDAPEKWIRWILDLDSGESRLAIRNGQVCGARLVEKAVVDRPFNVRGDGSYLVTGGAGALGLAVAEWLVARGAGEVVLAGRRSSDAALEARLVGWAERGGTVSYVMADVADAGSVRRLVAEAGSRRPLCGVFHAAGALRDGLLRQAEAGAFTSILGAKIGGAWELHRATQGQSLDCFVLFSSIASLLGSPGQANYAAGNAFLDGLARHRQAAGLPALSIQWGPWDEIGMTARLSERDRERVADRGLRSMSPTAALAAMESLLGAASGCVGVWAWDRAKYRTGLPAVVPTFYRRLFPERAPTVSAPVDSKSNQDLAALPLSRRVESIERLICESVAGVLGFASARDVDRHKGLFDLGIDSLTAIDLKLRLEKALGRTLRTTIAFDYPTAAAMAEHLATTLFPSGEPARVEARAVPVSAELPDELSQLSASDLEALLEEELKE